MSNLPHHLPLKPLSPSSDDTDDLALSNNASLTSLPSIWGIPLKYISLVTLAVQNSALTIIMHHSRVSMPPSRAYSAATAVLMSEILKGFISLLIAFARIEPTTQSSYPHDSAQALSLAGRVRRLYRDIFSSDCWKLSIPAILYVIQNNLQYVAASNLDAATFQVTYQMKILTTAAFSVLLLRKKLSSAQWISLLFLAVGVGVVQIQAGAAAHATVSNALESGMHPLKGFLAVTAACFTSGLAGVYFEMVLKNSQADLWVRNVQLSLFSLLPALAPILIAHSDQELSTSNFMSSLFQNFGGWAWATVSIQVLGGLVTAMVIKYSDNILKGFATSLSIVISFLASVALFDFKMTFTFVLGSSIVLIATWLYNQHPKRPAYLSLKDSISLNWMRGEKIKHVDSPVVVQPQFYGRLTAVSSTSSLSSLSNSLVITPPLQDTDGKESMRINFVR